MFDELKMGNGCTHRIVFRIKLGKTLPLDLLDVLEPGGLPALNMALPSSSVRLTYLTLDP